jgi:molecular chaperone Hsp33
VDGTFWFAKGRFLVEAGLMNPSETESALEVRSYFVRGRNALVARSTLTDLYLDYYLHQGQHGYQHQPEHDGMLKEALAALVLHCASRPRNEVVAWTLHFENPGLNLFVTGDNPAGKVVGQLFTENVKITGQNLFYSDLVRGTEPRRRSAVDFEGNSVFGAVETFYANSEQRLARLFEVEPEDYVFISAQPDCDEAWLAALDLEAVRELDRRETLSLLEKRFYRWECGCSQQRMLEVLESVMRRDPEGLFGGEASLRIGCPRCGARHVVSREALEGFVAGRN